MARTPRLPDAFAERPAPLAERPKQNAGRYHLGGYVDPSDPLVTEFRILAVREGRSQIDMLMEAVRDLLAKHAASKAFGK